MKRSRSVLYLLFTDWLILIGSFAVALYFRPYDKGMDIVSVHHLIPQMSIVLFYAFSMLGVFSVLELYKRKILLTPLQHIFAIFKATLIAVGLYVMAKGFSKSDLFIPSRWVLVYWSILLFIALAIHRLLLVRGLFALLSKTDMRRRVVIIGDTQLAKRFEI